MPQFDLYENPNPETCDWAPYLADLQHEMLSGLATRVIAPLVVTSPSVQPTISRLNPIVLVRAIVVHVHSRNGIDSGPRATGALGKPLPLP